MVDYIMQFAHSTNAQFSEQEKNTAIQSLESGKVVLFPNMPFAIADDENFILSSKTLDTKSKNVSFNMLNQQLKGTNYEFAQRAKLSAFMQRFALSAQTLIENLLPQYTAHLQIGRTSFRPAEIKGRQSSYRKDDTRLHVDAFVSSPVQNTRILRVFCNVNPHQIPRVWHLGEPFANVADKFLPQATKYNAIIAKFLQMTKITKSYRTGYDHYMLQLHDKMKKDMDYQNNVEKIRFDFMPGSTWVVFTDQVSHAALSGQYLLEQTFYLPVDAMQQPELSPLKKLEEMVGDYLV